MSGYMAIVTYSLEFFQRAGFALEASVCSILFCGIRAAASGLCSLLVDRAGRRVLLMASAGGVAVCYSGLALLYKVPALNVVPALPLVLLLSAGLIYSCGLASIPWCLTGEMFPLRMREIGNAISPAAYFLFSMLSVLLFPLMLERIGEAGLFAVHAGIMVAFFLFTLFVIPETKGLSLAQIETLFEADATEADVKKGSDSLSPVPPDYCTK